MRKKIFVVSGTSRVDDRRNFVSRCPQQMSLEMRGFCLLYGVLRLDENTEPICGTICIERHDHADTALHAEVAASGLE